MTGGRDDSQHGDTPIWYDASGEMAHYADWKARRRSLCLWLALIPWTLSAGILYAIYEWQKTLPDFPGELIALIVEVVAFFWVIMWGKMADRIDDTLPRKWPRMMTVAEFDALMKKRLQR